MSGAAPTATARHPASAESASDKAFLDAIATEALGALGQAGFFGGRPGLFPASDYEALARRVDACFEVPDTAITTIAARLFFGIGASLGPDRIVGLGTYFGNALVWLCARPPGSRYAVPGALACDIDPVATDGARRNFASLGTDASVEFSSAEAAALLRGDARPIDLLYIDIDDAAGERKAGYAPVLEAALPRLRPGALVIAHDRCVARFAADFERYMEVVHASGAFRATVTLPVDSYGMEVSLR